MGGSGSGRWGSRRPIADTLRRVDLAQLRRENPIAAHHHVVFSYERRDGGPVQTTVYFTETATRFGGRRLWFICPSCGRRCRVLFLRGWFKCRACCGLRYRSQAEAPADRALRAMAKIAKRLDPEAEGIDLPLKPKGMHWRTYERLENRYQVYDDRWAVAVWRRWAGRIG